MAHHRTSRKKTFVLTAVFFGVFQFAAGQGTTKWIAVGSLQNWFSEKSWEVEEGNVLRQQYGLRWPAQYNHTDVQAAKGFWIGLQNFTDDRGSGWPVKVVHVGPRVFGNFEFFPVSFDLHAQFDRPRVVVDGANSRGTPEEIDVVDPTLKADRMLETIANTAVGITVSRKIYAFSQQHHDNYHIFDITFTNTGYLDETNVQKLNQTLNGVYFYWQFRYSSTAEVRYVVNNSSGWGINTMNDARGPWYPDAPTDLKAQFAWHGYHDGANKPPVGSSPNAGTYDNIGAPIWNPGSSAGYVDPSDTTWRLGGAQIPGYVHIHADKAPTDTTDDPNQPATTNYVASDEPITQNNSQFDVAKMQQEYARMTEGHAPRHAWLVQPDGKFSEQKTMANIGAGAPGGWSSAHGYGPYTLAPGQSVRIVFAEAVNGLTRDEAVRIGKKFKDGVITTIQKNDSVLMQKGRLFETFRRAIANYSLGYNIPQAPYPPTTFTVASGGNRIALSWTASNEAANGFRGYRLYRATGKPDSTYRMIFECGPGTANLAVVYSFDDVTPIRGVNYYYYITAWGDPAANNGAGRTPAGSLESSRFYTQTYDPAFLKRPAPSSDSVAAQLRIAPNPFIISSSQNVLRFPNEPDKIAFFNIPGNCSIKIYTELGELIKEIDHTDGSGDAYWNSVTSSGQVIVSGVYIVLIENRENGARYLKKLVVIR
ncbi:MAG: hypothetical protein HY562_06845 [Ignavibacteriales bacterium]|nr:hypothetical protein [Ignavibacteriales bacterium]